MVLEHFKVNVLPVNDPPVLRGLPTNINVWEGQLFVYRNLSAYDPDSIDLLFSDDTDIFDIDEVTGRISFIPTSSDVGVHSVCVSATDGMATTSECFNVSVFSIPKPPVIAEIGDLKIEEGKSLDYRVIAHDENGDDLTYSASPSWIDIDPETGEISVTPGSDKVGSHDVRITVTDGTHTTTEEFTLEVRSTSNYSILAIVLAFIAIFVIIAFGFFSMRHRKLKEYYEEKQKKAEKKAERKTFMAPARTGRRVVRRKTGNHRKLP
jgi:hypothetical protein